MIYILLIIISLYPFYYKQLCKKKKEFNLFEHQSLFDLDTEKNLLGDPRSLLKFDGSSES